MKVYDVIITEDMLIKGVKAISLVENPAIEENFIALSKNEQLFKLAITDQEKQIVMGAVLVPDKPILRAGNPENFYIKFSKQTIENAQEYFFKSGFQNFTTIEHSGESIDGNTVVESWLVEDPQRDKTALYNLSYPEGTWVIKMKVRDKNLWDNYIKTGKLKGFSIEGFFKPVEEYELAMQLNDAERKVEELRNLLDNYERSISE